VVRMSTVMNLRVPYAQDKKHMLSFLYIYFSYAKIISCTQLNYRINMCSESVNLYDLCGIVMDCYHKRQCMFSLFVYVVGISGQKVPFSSTYLCMHYSLTHTVQTA